MSNNCDSDFFVIRGYVRMGKRGINDESSERDGECYNVNVDKLFNAPYKLIQGIYFCCN